MRLAGSRPRRPCATMRPRRRRFMTIGNDCGRNGSPARRLQRKAERELTRTERALSRSVSAGRARRREGVLEGLNGDSNSPAGHGQGLDGFCRQAAVSSDLEQSGSRQMIHVRQRGLLQAHALKPPKFPKLSVHASALDFPGTMRPRVCLTNRKYDPVSRSGWSGPGDDALPIQIPSAQRKWS